MSIAPDPHEVLCRSFASFDGIDGHPGDWDATASETVRDLLAAGYVIVTQRSIEESYWRGYRHGVRVIREAAQWSERRADECVQALSEETPGVPAVGIVDARTSGV